MHLLAGYGWLSARHLRLSARRPKPHLRCCSSWDHGRCAPKSSGIRPKCRSSAPPARRETLAALGKRQFLCAQPDVGAQAASDAATGGAARASYRTTCDTLIWVRAPLDTVPARLCRRRGWVGQSGYVLQSPPGVCVLRTSRVMLRVGLSRRFAPRALLFSQIDAGMSYCVV